MLYFLQGTSHLIISLSLPASLWKSPFPSDLTLTLKNYKSFSSPVQCTLKSVSDRPSSGFLAQEITNRFSGVFPYKIWDYLLSVYVTMNDLSPITIKHVPVTLPWLGTTHINLTGLLGWNKDCFGLFSWSLWSFLHWPITSQPIEKLMSWD